MPRTIVFEGRTIVVPDDYTDADISRVLASSPHATSETQGATALQHSVAYAVQQDPDKYAKQLQWQKQTGISPMVSTGNEQQVQQAAEGSSIDPQTFAAQNPRTTHWASNPDNAAVAGVDQLHALGGIEQNAAAMRSAAPPAASSTSSLLSQLWDTFKDVATHPLEMLVGGDTPAMSAEKETLIRKTAAESGSPFFKGLVAVQDAEKQPLLSVSGTQAFQRHLDPKSRNIFSRAVTGAVKSVESFTSPDNIGLLGSMAFAPEDAGALISGAFSAQMGEGAAASGTQAVRAARAGQYGDAAELGAGTLVSAAIAADSGRRSITEHIGAELAQERQGAPSPTGDPQAFSGGLAAAVQAAADSPLRRRAPDQFYQAMQTHFQGDPSLRIPVDDFAAYFDSKGMDAAAVAREIGATNYSEAVMTGGELEVPPADFLGKLDPEHQQALLQDVSDPTSLLTPRQRQQAQEDTRQWVESGGAEQLQSDIARADAATVAAPGWQAVKEELRQRYVDAGESPDVAESLATTNAHVYSNLAGRAGLKPEELLRLYSPDVVRGEAPANPVLYQGAQDGAEQSSPIHATEGRATSLLLPNGKMDARYVLAEASDLVPSHNPATFAKDARYPAGVQERAYDTSKEAQARVVEQAQNYEPAYTVNTNPDAVNGPPVVTPDGIVLGGNSRAMSTARLYAAGKGDLYRDALRRSANAFGLTPEQVDAMREPVLVRRVEAPAGAEAMRRLGSDLNKPMTGALGAAEKAVSAGKNLRPDTLRTVSEMLQDGDYTLRELMAAQGPRLVQMMVGDGVITPRERPQYVDPATGGLNEAGKSFVEKALLGSVVDDPRLMENTPRSVLNKVERSLGAITSFSTRADEWNILPGLREAIAEMGSIQRAGTGVETRIGQAAMFGDARNGVVDALLRTLDANPNAVRDAFSLYSRDAEENAPGQARMFAPAPAFEAFNHAFGGNLTQQEFADGISRAATEQRTSRLAGSESVADASAAGDEDLSAVPSGGARGGSDESAAGRNDGDAGRVRSQAPQVRGWFRVKPDGTLEVGKTKIGDLSTFVHETAHAYLHILGDLAKREGASDLLKQDYRKALDFLGASDGETLTTEQLEKWARANEQYLREGKAPSTQLRATFQRFSIWLRALYRRVSDLGVDLNDDIRGVFNRLYAADESVDRADTGNVKQLFTTPEEAGWSDEDFQKYADSRGLEVDQAKGEILAKLDEAALRERTKAWRDEERNVREAMTAQVDATPEYRAIRSLRSGAMDDGTPISLDRAELVRQFGEERVRELQRKQPNLYRVEGGIDPESAAEMLGFSSAQEMMGKLLTLPRQSRRAAIDAAVREFMTAKHGDIRYDGSLQDRAEQALASNLREANLHRELTTLGRRNTPEFELREAQRQLRRYEREEAAHLAAREARQDARNMESLSNALLDQTEKQQRQLAVRDERIAKLRTTIENLEAQVREAKQSDRAGKRFAQAVAPLESYRESARQMMEAKAPADIQPYRYLDSSRVAAREAFHALAKSDYWGAKQAKHKELLNHMLYREAVKAKAYVGKFEAFVERVQAKGAQGRLGLAGREYQEQVNRLLGRYGMGPSVTAERSLSEWASAQFDAGKTPAIDPAILDEARAVNYRNAPISEIRLLHDALVNVRKLASQELGMTVNGRKIEFDAAVNAMIQSAEKNLTAKLRPDFDENRTAAQRASDFVNRSPALRNKVEFLMKRLDGGATGPWHDFLFHLSADAQGRESALHEQVTKALGEALESIPAEQRRTYYDKVTIDGVTEPLTRGRMIAMALNMGNDGNLDRLERTFAAKGWEPRAIETIKGALTLNEWGFVQKVWDLLKPLGKEQSDLEYRLTGLRPAMVDATPLHVSLSDGSTVDLEGGYYPIAMDPKLSERGATQDANRTAQNMMEAGYVRAATSRGSMKERTGFGGPLLLDFEQVLTQHTAKVIKDITHREFMLTANKLLLDPAIRQTLRERLGSANEEQMMPWLRTQINDLNGSAVQGLTRVSAAMNTVRSNLVKAALGFKFSTILLQLTHASSIFLHTSTGSYAQAMIDFLAHPQEMSEQIRDLSPNEMANRGEHLDRDMRKVMQQHAGKTSIADVWGRVGMWPVQMMDHLLSFPLWLSVYRDALTENAHLADAEAKYQAMHKADGAVRMGLGASAPKDLAPMFRNNDLTKALTTLGGFHNLKYNQIADVVQEFRSERGSAGQLSTGLLLAAVIPAVLGAWITGRGPDKDENVGTWAAKRALLFAPETYAGWNIIVEGMEAHGDLRVSPVLDWVKRSSQDAFHAAHPSASTDGVELGMSAVRDIMEGLGVSGTDQAFKTARYARKVQQGRVPNPNAWDAVAGQPRPAASRSSGGMQVPR